MTASFSSLISALQELPRLFPDISVKVTLLSLLALFAHFALSRRRPLMRSAVWNAFVVSLIVLPLVSVTCPRWPLPCWLSSMAAMNNTQDRAAQPVSPKGSFAGFVPSPPPGDASADADPPQTPLNPGVSTTTAEPRLHEVEHGESRMTDATGRMFAWIGQDGWGWTLLAGIYGFGMCLLALRLLAGLWAIHRLRREAQPLGDDWTESCERLVRRLAFDQTVTVSSSNRISVPLTIGWRRPAIIIPSKLVDRLNRSQREAVLLHEMAHIQRADYAWQLLYRFTLAVYWPHPLVWIGGRLMTQVREQACDDWCAYHEAETGSYRDALIAVARSLVCRPDLSLGVAMARSPRLGSRLDRLARGSATPACFARWGYRFGAITVLLALTIPLAMTRLSTAAEPSDAGPTTKPVGATAVLRRGGVVPAKDFTTESRQKQASEMDPRPAVTRLIELVRQGNSGAAERWVNDNQQSVLINLGMLVRLNDCITIDRAWAAQKTAIVITKPIRSSPGDKGGVPQRPMVFRLTRSPWGWAVDQVSVESPERIAGLIEGFTAHPGTKDFSKKPLGKVASKPSAAKPRAGKACDEVYPADIIIEAEAYTGRRQGDRQKWYEVRGEDGCFTEGPQAGQPAPTAVPGARGNYMEALGPNAGYTPPVAGGYAGPVLRYRVRVSEPGRYALMARWAGADDDSDSLFAYLEDADGEVLHHPDFFMFHALRSGWRWRNDGLRDTTYCNAQGCPDRAIWTLYRAGEYVVCVAGRESGTALDALILRKVGEASITPALHRSTRIETGRLPLAVE